MSVAGAVLRDDLTIGDIESGEQRRRSMPIVVVGHPFDVAEPQRQDRLATFKRLDLRLFVDAENEGVIWSFRYRPTMSRTLSTNSGSVDSLKCLER